MKQKLLNLTRLRSLLLLACVMLGVSAWGDNYSYTFTSSVYSAAGAQTLNDVSWTMAGTGGSYFGYDGTKGQQFGSGNKPYSALSLTTSGIRGMISSVVVNTSGANSINGTVAVSVGTTAFTNNNQSTASLTATATNYTFTGSGSGDITISWAQTSSKAIYVKSITVTYTPSPIINAEDVNLAYNTTSGSITASIQNPVEGGVLSASTSSQNWLTIGTISGNTVPLTCSANTASTAREATVTLTYTYNTNQTVTKDVTVNQAAAPDPRIAFNPTEVTINQGDELPTISFSNPNSVPNITFTSSNTALATVSNTGEISLVPDATGTATITASFAGNDSYAAKNVTCVITVIPVHTAHFFVNGIEASSDDYAVGANIDFPDDPEDINGKTFVGWSTAAINSSTNTEPTLVTSATMGEEDVYYYAVFATLGWGTSTYTLDYDNENSLKSSTQWGSYGKAYEYTASDGGTWIVKAYKNNGMQINTDRNSSIKIPTCSGAISSISITGSAAKAVGFSSADYSGSGNITYLAEGTDATQQTLNLSSQNVTTGYIVPKSGSISITRIVVNYSSATYSGYCTTVKTAPEFSYATASYTVGYGASFETPVLTKPNDLDATQISYSISQNEGVATINATTGAVTIGNNAGTVTVTATFAGDNRYLPATASYTITVEPKVAITMNADGIRTYASVYGLDFSQVEGLTAYYATGYDKTNLSLTMTAVNSTAPGDGMMLKGEAGEKYLVPIITEGSTSTTNLLVGLTQVTNVSKIQTIDNVEYTTLILANKESNGINWYVLAEDSYNLKANSAYLRLPSSALPTTPPANLSMDFGGGSNGINTTTATKVDAKWYTLDGRLLQSKPSTKGIYLNNGHKVVIK